MKKACKVCYVYDSALYQVKALSDAINHLLCNDESLCVIYSECDAVNIQFSDQSVCRYALQQKSVGIWNLESGRTHGGVQMASIVEKKLQGMFSFRSLLFKASSPTYLRMQSSLASCKSWDLNTFAWRTVA